MIRRETNNTPIWNGAREPRRSFSKLTIFSDVIAIEERSENIKPMKKREQTKPLCFGNDSRVKDENNLILQKHYEKYSQVFSNILKYMLTNSVLPADHRSKCFWQTKNSILPICQKGLLVVSNVD